MDKVQRIDNNELYAKLLGKEKMGSLMVMGRALPMMEVFMKENGRTESMTDKELTFYQEVKNMKESGKMDLNMVKVKKRR